MDLLKRVIVAVIFVPLLLFVYYTGGVWLLCVFSFLSMLCTYEIFKMLPSRNSVIMYINIVLSVLLFCQIAYPQLDMVLCLLCLLLINGGIDLLCGRTEGFINRISHTIFACVYPAMGFGLTYRLTYQMTYHYEMLLPILAICIWMTDTCAYFIGKTFGKHKGIFKCSPNKTLEGFYAGLIAPLLCSFILYSVISDYYPWGQIIAVGVAAGLFGQVGDLFESMIKRDMGVKDSSHLIPGHGGVLDRFDSLLLAGPVLYVMLFFV